MINSMFVIKKIKLKKEKELFCVQIELHQWKWTQILV